MEPLDRRVLEALQASSGPRRKTREQLLDTVLGEQPHLRSSPDLRPVTATLVSRLADAGALRAPASRRLWDALNPPLPDWVELPAPKSVAAPSRPSVPWRPELRWATTLRLTASQRVVLERINTWLRDHPTGPDIPLRERSLQVLGHEKTMERLLGGTLFAPGRLTLPMLRCFATPPPLHTATVGDGDRVLVVENSATFHTLTRLLSDSATRPASSRVRWTCYGAGGLFAAAAPSLTVLSPAVIVYFGDLDVKGLNIPASAAAAAAAQGMPPIRPAAGLYKLLLDVGVAEPVGANKNVSSVTAGLGWLGSDLASRAGAVIADQRLAQEALRYDVLLAHDGLLADL